MFHYSNPCVAKCLSQLTDNIFCINNIREHTRTLYIYHEGESPKSKGCSLLEDYLKEIPEHVTELYIFCDKCSGQNKNQALCIFLLYLTNYGKFSKI